MPSLLWTAALLTGCFDENLPEVDVYATIVIPAEAVTYRVINPGTGLEEEVVDPRAIGPVFLGVYPEVKTEQVPYTQPIVGPIIGNELYGNAYPYGGGTAGRYTPGCFSSLICKTLTGRYTSFEDVLDFHNDTIYEPVLAESGGVVTSPDYFRSYCYELFEITADWELDLIQPLPEDGGPAQPQFTQNADGDFEAEIALWQVEYTKGMQLWAFVDTPESGFTFSTCDPADGQPFNEYTVSTTFGANETDVLNFPQKYLRPSDWVVGVPFTFEAESAADFRANPPDITVRLDMELN